MSVRVVRIFRCRPTAQEFDRVVRERLLPDLTGRSGCLAAVAGRQGPDQLGERAIVSLWSGRDAMVEAMGEDLGTTRFHPEFVATTEGRQLDVHEVVLDIPGVTGVPTILRIAGGGLSGGIESFAAAFGTAVHGAITEGAGPGRMLLLDAGGSRFVSVSWWPDWPSIERATGATIDDPIRTRRPQDVTDFQAVHYEVLAAIP